MNPRRQPNWEERYAQPGCCCGREPVDFLREHLDELPRDAALDLAMGEGRNALFLAQHGFSVTGIDNSPTGVAKAEARAREQGLRLKTVVANLESYALPVEEFDVVLCCYYLQRSLFPQMERALKQGGALLVQTLTVEQLQFSTGPRNREHLLEPNELYRTFRHLRVAYYREVVRGERAVASLLAYRAP